MSESRGEGALQYQMDTGVRLTLPKAGAFGEKKKWGVIGWEAKFWFKIRGYWVRMLPYFWSFSERFKSRNLKKKIVENGKKMINLSMKLKQKIASYGSRKKNRGSGWVRLKSPHFTKKCGVFGWQQRQSAKIWGHWVTRAALKIGGVWSLTSASPLVFGDWGQNESVTYSFVQYGNLHWMTRGTRYKTEHIHRELKKSAVQSVLLCLSHLFMFILTSKLINFFFNGKN